MKTSKKILVTGAKGQLGQTIKELYSNNKIELKFTFASKRKLNITNKEQVRLFFNKNKFDYCINCAAYTNVEQAEKTSEIAFKVNTVGVKNLALACKDTNTVLIHISTDYVFDGEKKEPYTVEDRPNPINEYGKSKLLGELNIQEILNDFFIVRTSWLYSKKHGNNFYKTILKKAEKQKLTVIDNETGCPTDTVNLVNYLLKLILENRTEYGLLHFCDDRAMTWFDFAEEILIENNLLDAVELVKGNKYKTLAQRPKHSVLLTTDLNRKSHIPK